MSGIIKGIGNLLSTGKSSAERYARQQENYFREMEAENRAREQRYEQQRQEADRMMQAQMAETAARAQEAENRQQTLLALSQENEQLLPDVEVGGGALPEDDTRRRKRPPVSLASSLNIGV